MVFKRGDLFLLGVKGFWIYKMTVWVPLNNDEKECFDWYTRNKDQKAYSQLSTLRGLIRCPCNNILLRFDPRYAISRYDRSNRVLCYASMITGRNAVCCKLKSKSYSEKILLSKLSIHVPLKYIFEYFSRTGCGFAFIYLTEKDIFFYN